MKVCPNCKKELAEDAKFCTGCGKKLETVQETAQPKKRSVNLFAIAGGGILAAVVLIALVIGMLNFGGNGKYVVYLKNGALYVNTLNGKESLRVTKKLTESGSLYSAAAHVCVSEDGKRIFYPEKYLDGEFDLYYRSTTDTKKEGERIAKGISGYTLSADGKMVYYVKNSTLYKYDFKEETEIEDELKGFWYSEDGNKLLYLTEDYDLYQWKGGKKGEKIAKNIELFHVSEDASTVFYADEERNLYVWKEGLDAEKIDEKVSSFVIGYADGSAYYKKDTSITKTMADYIQDDYASSDAAIKEPVYPNYNNYEWPQSPQRPWSWGYASNEEYQKALEEYEALYAAYTEEYNKVNEQYHADVDNYNTQYTEWSQKNRRDNLRKNFASYEYEITTASLYYFDGEKSVLVAENLSTQAQTGCEYSHENAVYTFYLAKTENLEKISIDEITSLSTVNRQIQNALNEEIQFAVATKSAFREMEAENVENVEIAPNGKELYYVVSKEEGRTIYRVSLGGEISEAEEYDNGVEYVCGIIGDGALAYFKDFDSEEDTGTLYIAKEKVAKEVYFDIASTEDGERIYLWRDVKDREGTLVYYDGEDLQEIEEDAYAYDYVLTEEGGILYLQDYSAEKREGELHYYLKGKEAKVIDDDVTLIITGSAQ